MKNDLCVVTGANSGVGLEASLILARLGAKVILVCRNRERGEGAVERISEEVPSADLRLEVKDLASLAQVRELGESLGKDFPAVHLLVNNAGVYRGKMERTEDGFERTFAVNHLSHFLLTHLLLPQLLKGGGRVINVSSGSHKGGKLSPESLEEAMRGRSRYSGMGAYCDSKLANVLFTAGLARRYGAHEVTACSLHPGVLATRIWNQKSDPLSFFMLLFKPFMGRPSVGGDAVAYLSQAPAETVHGKYFNKKKEVAPSPLARDRSLAESLWTVSEKLLGLEGGSNPTL